jgi:hypothetical protein
LPTCSGSAQPKTPATHVRNGSTAVLDSIIAARSRCSVAPCLTTRSANISAGSPIDDQNPYRSAKTNHKMKSSRPVKPTIWTEVRATSGSQEKSFVPISAMG